MTNDEIVVALKKIEAVLLRDSAARNQHGEIAAHHFVGKAILMCRDLAEAINGP